MLRFARHPICPCFLPGSGLAYLGAFRAVGLFGGRRFFALCLRGGLRPATFRLLVCLAVLLFEPPALGLFAISSPVSSHAVARIMFVLVRLLAFSPGAASLRFARAAVLRPAPFCLLVSFALVSSCRLFLQWVWAAFFGAARPSVCLSTSWLGSCFCLVCLVLPPGAAPSRWARAAIPLLVCLAIFSFVFIAFPPWV